jgi:sugar lactone lactonase YvrE
MLALLALAVLTTLPASVAAKPFPTIIDLPNGFQPEGIAIAPGGTFFVGSIPTGAIYSGDVRTGEGEILVPAQEGRQAIGLAVDTRGRLFVAGGPTGAAYVYDTATGATLATYQLTTNTPTFVNDVVVTKDAAWFTDSFNPVLYRVPIAPNGALAAADEVETVPLTGDYQHLAGFNVNGIDATPNGKTLVIVQSGPGRLFTVDPATGLTQRIDLGGESVPNGDGILLDGKTLYVVQNRLNLVAVVELASDLASGVVTERLGSPNFAVPTTVAEFGHALYLVNARFGTPPTPDTTYTVVRIEKPAGH